MNFQFCRTLAFRPSVTGFGNVPIVSYDEVEKMGDRKLKLCAMTWNVNEKSVKILQYLAQKIKEKGEEMDSDILFISLQEIPSTATLTALVYNSTDFLVSEHITKML